MTTETMNKWAILVYIAADDKLANFAIESLKQMKDTAGEGVVVAAQLGLDGPETHVSKRYVFNRKGDPMESIRNFLAEKQPRNGADMADPKTLTEFVVWAHAQCATVKNYCLILWGHGPELLHEAPTKAEKPTTATRVCALCRRMCAHVGIHIAETAEDGRRRRLYFTPVELKEAFAGTPFNKENKLQIIAMDACSMSLIEFGYELKDVVQYMVASQEEVPDLSFPYDTLLEHVRECPDPETLCRQSVNYYIEAYQDYFWDLQNGLKRLTLSALCLEKIESITNPLEELVDALLKNPDKKLDAAILEARKMTQGFVGGLFVDLGDFCHQLSAKLEGDQFNTVKHACDNVFAAIERRKPQAIDPDGWCIVDNRVERNVWGKDAQKNENAPKPGGPPYGLSIYFPYLTDQEKDDIEASIFMEPDKGPGPGGDTIGKGPGPGGDTIGKGAEIINTAARSIQYAVRREIIRDTEAYYHEEGFSFKEIGWGNFIRSGWSRILAEKEPDDLDLRYSGQQCAINLLHSIPKKEGKEEEEKIEEGEAALQAAASGA